MGEGLAELLSYRNNAGYPNTKRSPLELVTAAERYGYRHNTDQPKGEGWLGNVNTKELPVTEYTIKVQGREIPTLVPGLAKEQVEAIRKAAIEHRQVPQDVVEHAVNFAREQNLKGLSQFKD